MYRLALAVALALSVLAFGVAPSAVHAQAATPTVTVTPGTVAAGGTATVQGSGFTPNNYVFVYWQRPDGTTNGGWLISDAAGQFAFTLGFLTSHGTGPEYIAAYDYATGRWSPWFVITVTGTAPISAETLSANPNPVVLPSPTETFTAQSTVTGTRFSPNNYVYVQWQRPDGTVGSTYVVTDANGQFSFTLGFLPSHNCGNEVLQAFDEGTQTWSAPYTIVVRCGA